VSVLQNVHAAVASRRIDWQMKAQQRNYTHRRTIEGLMADGPTLETREKLKLFGQFVGDWDILEDRNLMPDGTWSVAKGELHWGWILDGGAVQ
jgi:hypothetical protein